MPEIGKQDGIEGPLVDQIVALKAQAEPPGPGGPRIKADRTTNIGGITEVLVLPEDLRLWLDDPVVGNGNSSARLDGEAA